MFDKLWDLMKRWVVQDVPDEMAACLTCGAVQCTEDRYHTCPDRLKTSAALKTMRASAAGRGGAT